jgi:hypothetical protein
MASMPSATISSAAAFTAVSSISISPSLAPLAANALLMAAPMPLAAPVTTVILFFSSLDAIMPIAD